MAKVITFSRQFPAYHPKAGQPTYFVEKFWKSLYDQNETEFMRYEGRYQEHFPVNYESDLENIHNHTGKHHTIRAGHRWKAGDYFSPRVWSAKPYNSPMITIAPDTLIAKTFDFAISDGLLIINGDVYAYSSSTELIDKLAENDGLTHTDLLEWFKYPKPFKGQIICWNPNINY